VPDAVRQACSIATDWSMFARHVIEHLTRPERLANLNTDRARFAEALSADATYAELRQVLEGSQVDGAGATLPETTTARPAVVRT
jgi:hypothetical protein